MERYITFFFYGKRPSQTPAILEFVDWLVESTTGKGGMHVVARESLQEEGRPAEELIQGDFSEYRSKLRNLSLHALNVSSTKRTSAGTEIFFRYESPPGGPKTITFSLRLDLWVKCEQNGFSTHLLEATERLFVAHDCLYGYGHPTYYVIPGRFSLIRANAQSGVPRIIDFDYAHYIEDVYQYNYLSQSLSFIIDKIRLREHPEGIVIKDILSPGGGPCAGLAIYLTADSAKNIAWVRDSLRPVLWTGQAISASPLAVPGRKN